MVSNLVVDGGVRATPGSVGADGIEEGRLDALDRVQRGAVGSSVLGN